MPRLTWDNVAAPSFAGVADSYRVMSQLLGNATRSGLDMVDTVRNANAEMADRAILQRMVGVTDPTQYDPTAVIGADGSRASLATLRGVGDYAGTLLNRAAARSDLDFANYGRSRVMEGNAVLDANSDAINTARSLAISGRIGEAQRVLSGIQGLRTDQAAEILGDVDQYGTRAQARDVVGQRLTESRYDFGNQVQADRDQRAATAAINTALRNSSSPADARVQLEGMADQLTPEAFTRAIRGLEGSGFGNVYAPATRGSGVPVGSAGSVSAATSVMTGGNALPANIRTVGDMVNSKGSLLDFNPRGTATGIYQITSDTWKEFGPKALGANWQDADIRDPQVQDRVAEAIWNSARDSATKISGRWASIPESQARNLVGRSWDEVRDIVSQGETSTNGSEILASASEAAFAGHMANRRLTERTSQNNAQGISAIYAQALQDNSTAEEVSSRLIGEGGALAGTNKDFVLGQINEIVQDSNGRISPAIAGQMIERSLESAGGVLAKGFRRLGNIGGLMQNFQPTLSNNQRIDQGDLDGMIDDYLSGRTSIRTLSNESMGAMAQVAQAAQAQYQAALQQYQAALIDSRTRPGAAQNLPRYRQAVQQAAAQLDLVQQQVAGNPNWRPDFNQTTVPPPEDEQGDPLLFGLVRRRPTPSASSAGSR